MVRIRRLQHIRMAAEPFRVNSKVTATEPPRRTGKPGRSSSSPTVRGSTKPRVGCNASIHPAAPRSPRPCACFQRRTLPLADCTTQMRRGDILREKKKKSNQGMLGKRKKTRHNTAAGQRRLLGLRPITRTHMTVQLPRWMIIAYAEVSSAPGLSKWK